MDATGKIILIREEEKISDRFTKREIVLEYATNPQYPESVLFQFVQDRCELLDNFKVGQEVTIHFDLKGRKWTNPQGEDKYFNTLQGWRISEAGQPKQLPASSGGGGGAQTIPPPPEFSGSGGQVDEIPF